MTWFPINSFTRWYGKVMVGFPVGFDSGVEQLFVERLFVEGCQFLVVEGDRPFLKEESNWGEVFGIGSLTAEGEVGFGIGVY